MRDENEAEDACDGKAENARNHGFVEDQSGVVVVVVRLVIFERFKPGLH